MLTEGNTDSYPSSGLTTPGIYVPKDSLFILWLISGKFTGKHIRNIEVKSQNKPRGKTYHDLLTLKPPQVLTS